MAKAAELLAVQPTIEAMEVLGVKQTVFAD
jgi:hypothetical protein